MSSTANTFDAGEPHPVAADARGALAGELLGADPARCRDALHAVRSRRVIDLSAGGVVRYLLLLGRPGRLRTLGHLLASSGRRHSLVALHGDGLVLLTSARRTDDEIAEWLQRSARDAGIGDEPVIGSARLGDDDRDIGRAVADARAAAELLARAGADTIGSGRAEDLGLWRLLHGMQASPETIAAASPAAAELWRSSDETRRTTIETYLDAGCNVAAASKALFIHRTTLYYRLESMPTAVRDALADGTKRTALHVALKLLRLNPATPTPPAETSATITRLHSRQPSERAPGALA